MLEELNVPVRKYLRKEADNWLSANKKMRELFELSFDFWNEGKYFQAIEIWKTCLDEEQFVDEIVGILEEAFLQPNEMEYIKSYQANIEKLCGKSISTDQAKAVYKELNIRFLCPEEGYYYLYDSEKKKILGLIDFSKKFDIEKIDTYSFEDVLIVNPLRIVDILSRIHSEYIQNFYCVGEEKKEFQAIYMIPEMGEILEQEIVYLDNKEEVEAYFLSAEGGYLPKKIVGSNDEKIDEYGDLIKELHDKKCTKKYRKDGNILLSICIPTFNRGHVALRTVKQMLNMLYDDEIEIIVSDNGSDKYVEEYKEIEKIEDSRLRYYRNENNIRFAGNYKRMFELARGKYLLFVSDEDFVVNSSLTTYLSVLRNQKEVGIVRGSGESLYADSNMKIHNNEIILAGDESVKHIFAFNNYFCGDIFRIDDKNKQLINEIYDKFKNTNLLTYYPHMIYATLCSYTRDIVLLNKILIQQGKAADEGDGEKNKDGLFNYATVEGRLAQLTTWREVIEQLEEVSISCRMELFIVICSKTFLLANIVKDYYKDDWEEVCEKIKNACIEEYKKSTFLPEKIKEAMGYRCVIDTIEEIKNKYL